MWNITSTCKGGGYVYARTVPLHPKANSKGLYPLHRVLMENFIGRLLTPDEVVHHKDGDKSNNDISNLVLLTRSKHSILHKPTLDLIKFKCAQCGKDVSEKPHQYRLRAKRTKGKLFCSIKCSAKHQWSNQGKFVQW